jgi:predicted  nucleic acid-binding Zn-ribbon protein
VADSGFACMECGHRFRTLKAAERASFGADGCPKCGSSDIDLSSPKDDARLRATHNALERIFSRLPVEQELTAPLLTAADVPRTAPLDLVVDNTRIKR